MRMNVFRPGKHFWLRNRSRYVTRSSARPHRLSAGLKLPELTSSAHHDHFEPGAGGSFRGVFDRVDTTSTARSELVNLPKKMICPDDPRGGSILKLGACGRQEYSSSQTDRGNRIVEGSPSPSSDPPARRRLRPWENYHWENDEFGYDFLKELIGDGDGSWDEIEKNLRRMKEINPYAVLEFSLRDADELSEQMAERPINGLTFSADFIMKIQEEARDGKDVNFV